MRERRLISAMASEKLGPGPSTKVRTVLQVEAPVPRSDNALKRPHIHLGVRPIPSLDREQSQGISTQRIELVVTPDTESETGEEARTRLSISVANSITAIQILKTKAVLVQVFVHFSPKYAVIVRVLSS
jgi:hypothetical protein